MNTVKFEVPAISCGHCVNSIQNELKDVPGIAGVWADQASKIVEVEFGPPADEELIKKTLSDINYPVKE